MLIAASMIGPAMATSGRTDKNGCHNSSKIGYHCHNGGNSRSTATTTSSTSSSPRTTTAQAPIVSSSITEQEYLMGASKDSTTPYNFDVCAQASREKSMEVTAKIIENSARAYAAEFSENDGSKTIVVCHRDNQRTIISK